MYVGPQPMDPVVHIVLEMPGVPRLQATTAFFFFLHVFISWYVLQKPRNNKDNLGVHKWLVPYASV